MDTVQQPKEHIDVTGVNVIEARGLKKDRVSSFLLKRSPILDDLSLTVREGETYGLLGPNGAGKTTTVKILVGLIKPDSGDALVLGQKAGEPEALKQIGFLPENPYFYSHLTGYEFLEFIGQLFALKKKELKERMAELLELVGMTADANQPMRKYSKGMLQRLGIAQSLINNPKVIFWDEPMSGLDPIGRRDVRKILERLKSEGKTIFFNSHLLPDVSDVCDRVGVLVKGKLVAEDSIKDIERGGGYKDLEEYFLTKVGG
ncbi:MAG: ABC transporter ATP-binding protein [Candidatus Melainabacteria bacterium]|nr:ABC transporter ATP-binding protein [Candidatus Melainabacteria bacterium]